MSAGITDQMRANLTTWASTPANLKLAESMVTRGTADPKWAARQYGYEVIKATVEARGGAQPAAAAPQPADPPAGPAPATVAPPSGQATSQSPTVSRLANGLISIRGDDGSAVVLRNMNNGGPSVDEFAAFGPSDRRVVFGINSGARLQSAVVRGNGDAGIGTIAQGPALQTMQARLEALHRDAADGTINDFDNYALVKQGLTDATAAGGQYHRALNAQANFDVAIDGVQADIKTAPSAAGSATPPAPDEAVITFSGGSTRLYIGGMSNSPNGGGPVVREAGEGDGQWREHGRFRVASDREMGLEGTGMLFPDRQRESAAGSVIDPSGEQHTYLGRSVFWEGRSELFDRDGIRLLNDDGSPLRP